MEKDNKKFWVGFNQAKGIGPVRFRMLLDHFGNLEKAWNASKGGLLQAGLPKKILENFIQFRDQFDFEKVEEQIHALDVQVLTWEDEGYPARLLEIQNSPPVIFLRGNYLLEDRWAVAIVGTRRVSPYGRQIASDLATYLAQNGVTVISGLARGVDGIAQKAALKAGGRTISVLGCGVDQIYPPENKAIFNEIIESGAIISDYGLGTLPESHNFPPRNRIISGLSLASVIIEAGRKSGALITASYAAEQGREVFSVPGNIYAPMSKGTNHLIQQGARPLIEFDELLDLLDLRKSHQHQIASKTIPSDKNEFIILKVISDESLHIDDILDKTNLTIEEVSATLAILELKGLVRQAGGMNYTICREVPLNYGE
ncbi:MAG: DNA-protecting protein DprA [Anaerolineaceae bacterium]|nr:DNA-protecting protein DprA [Anaerolineaceae bacterium]